MQRWLNGAPIVRVQGTELLGAAGATLSQFTRHLAQVESDSGHSINTPHWVYNTILNAAQALHGGHFTIVQHNADDDRSHRIADDGGELHIHIGLDNRGGVEHWVALAVAAVSAVSQSAKRT